MTRDYKKNVARKKSASSSPTQAIMPFISGLVIGLFVALIVYLNEHQAAGKIEAPQLIVEDKNKAPEVSKTEAAIENNAPEPQFDFYQILPNMEVNVSEWVAEDDKEQQTQDSEPGVYILQVGSFEQYEAADEVKAKLALLGINADIQRVVINGRDIRHRVRVGPFSDPSRLQEAKELLSANHLDFMLLKLKLDDI